MQASLPFLLLLGCDPAQPKVETGTPLPADTALDSATPDTADSAPPADTAPPVETSPPCPTDEAGLLAAVEGDFVPASAEISGTRDRCAAILHATAGAAGSTLRVALTAWSGAEAPTLTWLGPTGLTWAAAAPLAMGDGATLTLPQSGELLLRLDPADVDAEADTYSLSVTCIANCELQFTRYPIVLMHGMGGSDGFLDVIDYFYEVPEALETAGYPVAVPVVDAFDTVADRAAQWQANLDSLEALGVGRRFNLIAHSQGGLDARYLTGALLDGRVASVITVGSPHHGSAVADAANGLLSSDPLVAEIVNLVAEAVGALVGLPGDDIAGQTADLTTESMAAFNEAVPDVPGVYYASWAGHSCGALSFGCQDETGGEVVDPLLAITEFLLYFEEGDNDGLVSTDSAVWGDYQGEIPTDHLDEIGQIADEDNPVFDHVAFYLDEAARLASLGY